MPANPMLIPFMNNYYSYNEYDCLKHLKNDTVLRPNDYAR